MTQWLVRGAQIDTNIRIKEMVANSQNYQIYSVSQKRYALVVNDILYNQWLSADLIPDSIFRPYNKMNGFWLIISNYDYMISSFSQGPYPVNYTQIEAFSIAFKKTTSLKPDICLENAVYIEEYSLILPECGKTLNVDPKIAYGRWITGGVKISIDSIKRVEQLLSWLPPNSIEYLANLAGFCIKIKENTNERTEAINNTGKSADRKDGLNKKFHLVGRPELETFFNDNIVDILINTEKYKLMGIPFPGATILHGVPGCGKTYAVQQFVDYLGWPAYYVDAGSIGSSFIHETSKRISDIFAEAIDAAPAVIIIDEMESFMSNRSFSSASGSTHIEEVSEFLRIIPEAISMGVLIFAMTNMIEAIDPALLRKGRFDHIIEVKMATTDEIKALLDYKCSALPIDNEICTNEIAQALTNHPLSDVDFVLREAGRIAIKQNKPLIDSDCFNKAIHSLPHEKKENIIGF